MCPCQCLDLHQWWPLAPRWNLRQGTVQEWNYNKVCQRRSKNGRVKQEKLWKIIFQTRFQVTFSCQCFMFFCWRWDRFAVCNLERIGCPLSLLTKKVTPSTVLSVHNLKHIPKAPWLLLLSLLSLPLSLLHITLIIIITNYYCCSYYYCY